MPAADSALTIGKKAPDFTLPDQDDKAVKLKDLAGRWVVLYFYPKDDTPGCTVEACDFTAGLKDFEKLEATVLGCSADSTERHRKFIAKYKLKISLLSDPDHEVIEKYGAWGEKNLYGKVSMGIIRSTVIIDPAGKVARHWPKVKSAGHADEVRDALKELRK
jgi:thioredoxin-dependent peroxiredoxin